jgi:hypothetical protein
VYSRSAKARLGDLGCLPGLEFLKRNNTSIGPFEIASGGPRARSENVAFPFSRVVACMPLCVVKIDYVNEVQSRYTRGLTSAPAILDSEKADLLEAW